MAEVRRITELGPTKSLPVLLLVFACLPFRPAAAETTYPQAVKAAHHWLEAEPPQRAAVEPVLSVYQGDIDAVMDAIRPKGSPEHAMIKGREVKDDTFTVPKLLARNEDHPFNFYVPPHYDPAKPTAISCQPLSGQTRQDFRARRLRTRTAMGKPERMERRRKAPNHGASVPFRTMTPGEVRVWLQVWLQENLPQANKR